MSPNPAKIVPDTSHQTRASSRFEEMRFKALELFVRRGFAQVGMCELAQHLGIGAESIYHRFTSKEHLLFDVIEDLYSDLLEAAVLTESVNGNPFLALLSAHAELLEQRPLYFLLGEQELCYLSSEYQELIQGMRARYEEALLHRLLDAGACASPPILRATVRAVVSCLNNLPTWAGSETLSPAQRREVIDAVINGVLSIAFQQSAPPD
ncbi:TetR/AcrR family transcriptional regulator [Pseudomonas sp. SO81]|uniref:TetR/AcrR family transcriptional regulator n=1 Tax=Pseudomonas sp. SO81 TaxID=2983246 RepID=UPI0025A34B48|nr:TetR/AcrR family transcriptional regulator [Pseudomonas sp. SO81]